MLCCFGKRNAKPKRTLSPYKVKRRNSRLRAAVQQSSGEIAQVRRIVIKASKGVEGRKEDEGREENLFGVVEDPHFQTDKGEMKKIREGKKSKKDKRKKKKRSKGDKKKKQNFKIEFEQNDIKNETQRYFKSEELQESSLNEIYVQLTNKEITKKEKESPMKKSSVKYSSPYKTKKGFSDCDISVDDEQGPADLMHSEVNESEYNLLERQLSHTSNAISVTAALNQVNQPSHLNQSIEDTEPNEPERSEIIFSVNSINLSETKEFNENIAKNELTSKLELKMNPRISMSSNKYWRSERESVASEISFNSEISSVAVSSYRKSIFNEQFLSNMRNPDFDRNEESVDGKMRVLTPTRSVESFDTIPKVDNKARCYSLAEIHGSRTMNRRVGYMMTTTNDATSNIEERSVRLSAHMPGNMLRNAVDNYEIEQELQKHRTLNSKEDNLVDAKESTFLRKKMGEYYSKIIQRNYEIDAVKYKNKKLDKRINYLKEKAMKLSKTLQCLEAENYSLRTKEMDLLTQKIV